MTKLLIVEDDINLGSHLKVALQGCGFEVDWLTNGEEGYYWLQESRYAAAIIDWSLPGLSGIDICRQYRELCGNTRILMLTAKCDSESTVTGLNAGADDYIRKPVDLKELVARVGSLLRRGESYQAPIVRVGILELDSTRRICRVNQTLLSLPKKEFAILELLAKNPGHVFSAQKIIDQVWPAPADASTAVIRVHVTKLRQRLNAVSQEVAEYLVNVYSEGYKLEPTASCGNRQVTLPVHDGAADG